MVQRAAKLITVRWWVKRLQTRYLSPREGR